MAGIFELQFLLATLRFHCHLTAGVAELAAAGLQQLLLTLLSYVTATGILLMCEKPSVISAEVT